MNSNQFKSHLRNKVLRWSVMSRARSDAQLPSSELSMVPSSSDSLELDLVSSSSHCYATLKSHIINSSVYFQCF